MRPLQVLLNSFHLDAKRHRCRKLRGSRQFLLALAPWRPKQGLHSIPQRDGYHRCLPLILGCSVAEQHGPWTVVHGRPGCAHQSAGAASSSPGSQTLHATPKGQGCPDTVRQHIDCVSYQPPGWDQVCTAIGGGKGPPRVGGPPLAQPSSHVFAGTAEPPGRLPVPSRTSTGGMASPPRGVQHHLEPLRQSGGGPKMTSPLGQDTLAHPWPDSLLYAFPPLPLIWLVLHRVLQESHRILLVAPFWPGRCWFLLLHRLCRRAPWRLPNCLLGCWRDRATVEGLCGPR